MGKHTLRLSEAEYQELLEQDGYSEACVIQHGPEDIYEILQQDGYELASGSLDDLKEKTVLQKLHEKHSQSDTVDAGKKRESNKKTRSRFNASAKTVDGVRFHSKGEAARYTVLKRYQEMGIISDLDLQNVFVLQEKQTVNGIKLRAITYKVDFSYTYNGKQWHEDWKRKSRNGKPFLTSEFKRTYKMFLAKHPDVNFWINCEMSALPT